MKVVILCGGRGTRMGEETEYRPKPLVNIGGLPIVWHIMKYYSCFGHREFILCLGYKGAMFKDYFRNYLWNACDVTFSTRSDAAPVFHCEKQDLDWTITFADTGEETMTACRVKRIQKYVPAGEPFLLTYGDGLSDIDIDASIREHNNSGRVCTISAVHPAGRFGAITVEKDGSIRSFEEKPQLETDYVNGGYMVCDHRMFDYLPDDQTVMLEREPMMNLVRDRQLHSYRHDGFWQPMDNQKEMKFLASLWDSGRAPWKIW
jgi:glucose-1-phosphate cytidylyltransferase